MFLKQVEIRLSVTGLMAKHGQAYRTFTYNVISWLNSNDFANLLDAFKEILCDCAENIC